MSKNSWARLIFSGLLALVLAAQFVLPVSAAGDPAGRARLRNTITLDDVPDVNMGESFVLSGTIKDLYDRPVVDKPIVFYLDGEYLGQAPSDENGAFSREFRASLDAGTYAITVESNRTRLLLEASAETILRIKPAVVTVQAIPALPNVGFKLDGRKFYTNKDGFATIAISKPGTYRLTVLTDEYKAPNERIELGRWTEEIFRPYQDITVPANRVIQVGLNVFHMFSQDFVDLDGKPVDPARVSELAIRSLQGDMFVLQDGEPRWFPASRTARRLTGLEETKMYYSVLRVIVDGSNVVNQSQQRFYTSPGGNLTIGLTLYSLTVNARDGMFGWPVGTTLQLEYPDGRIEEFPLDRRGSVTIDSLARGTYYISIAGAKSLDNRVPVALSRNQNVNSKIITYLDIGVFVSLGFVVVIGLLFYGRPWVWFSMLKTVRKVWARIPTPSLRVSLPVNGKTRAAALAAPETRKRRRHAAKQPSAAKTSMPLKPELPGRRLKWLSAFRERLENIGIGRKFKRIVPVVKRSPEKATDVMERMEPKNETRPTEKTAQVDAVFLEETIHRKAKG